MDDFVRCRKRIVMYDAFWVKRIKESCIKKDVWFCISCSEFFHKSVTVAGHSTTCPNCRCRLVLNYKNKYDG